MKFGTGSNTVLTQKYVRVKVQNDMRTYPHMYKQISPILNSTPLYSVSLASLACQLIYIILINFFSPRDQL